MSTCFEPHRASLKMSIVPAFGSSWFENYSIYKKRHVFFGTPCKRRSFEGGERGVKTELYVGQFFAKTSIIEIQIKYLKIKVSKHLG